MSLPADRLVDFGCAVVGNKKMSISGSVHLSDKITGRYLSNQMSGIPWFEDVPEHWKIIRLKFVTYVNPSKSDLNGLDNDTEVSFLPMEYVGFGNLTLSLTRRISDVYQGFTYFRNGDILVAKITPSFENGKGAIAEELLNGIGFGTTELHVIRPSSLIGTKYLFYVTLSQHFRVMGAIYMRGTAGQKRVEDFFINNYPTPIPPLPEQRAIADFLDRETARIDALIAKKQRLIKLLEERRTALISQAVTEGLNPDVPMKDSGVEWLGEIPAHWELSSIGKLFEVKLGKMLNSKVRNDNEIIKPYLRAANIYWEGVDTTSVDVYTMGFSSSQLFRYRLKKDDLLVTEGGVTVGRSAIWSDEIPECYYQNSINRVRSLGIIPTKFLYYWIYFLKHNGYIDIVAEKSTFGHLTNEKLKALPFVIPDQEETIRIAKQLDQFWAKTDAVITQIKNNIAKILEYRSSLISAAVTGKIDVQRLVT
jgi:type I restriction enzyme, S subunit